MLRCLAVTWNFPTSLLVFLVVLMVSGVLLDTPMATVLSCSGKLSGTVPSPQIMPMERASSIEAKEEWKPSLLRRLIQS